MLGKWVDGAGETLWTPRKMGMAQSGVGRRGCKGHHHECESTWESVGVVGRLREKGWDLSKVTFGMDTFTRGLRGMWRGV